MAQQAQTAEDPIRIETLFFDSERFLEMYNQSHPSKTPTTSLTPELLTAAREQGDIAFTVETAAAEAVFDTVQMSVAAWHGKRLRDVHAQTRSSEELDQESAQTILSVALGGHEDTTGRKVYGFLRGIHTAAGTDYTAAPTTTLDCAEGMYKTLCRLSSGLADGSKEQQNLLYSLKTHPKWSERYGPVDDPNDWEKDRDDLRDFMHNLLTTAAFRIGTIIWRHHPETDLEDIDRSLASVTMAEELEGLRKEADKTPTQADFRRGMSEHPAFTLLTTE